jgi:hypothetical protein
VSCHEDLVTLLQLQNCCISGEKTNIGEDSWNKIYLKSEGDI